MKKQNKSNKTSKSKRASPARGVIAKIKKAKVKKRVMFDFAHYPQTEDFTSSAACAMMVLKHINPSFKFKKEHEYKIWQEAVSGSVWHGSKYGLAYALAKRGAKVGIISNTKDEGYEKKLAVYENINLDTLAASFKEIKEKASQMKIEEEYSQVTPQLIKRALSAKHIPIVVLDAKAINTYLDSSPHWVVVKGYDRDNFYINDPYSDSTITMDASIFKSALGFENYKHMVIVDSKYFNKDALKST